MYAFRKAVYRIRGIRDVNALSVQVDKLTFVSHNTMSRNNLLIINIT